MLSCGAMGLSAVCDCVFPDHTHYFCCALLYDHSSFAIISMGNRERAGCFAFFWSSWCLVIVVWLFLTMPRVCLQFVIVVFPDPTHYFS